MDTWRLWRIEQKVDRILRTERWILMDQATFDTELAGLVTAVTELSSAIDAFITAHPAIDFATEGQQVTDATTAVQAELDKLNPAVTPPAA